MYFFVARDLFTNLDYVQKKLTIILVDTLHERDYFAISITSAFLRFLRKKFTVVYELCLSLECFSGCCNRWIWKGFLTKNIFIPRSLVCCKQEYELIKSVCNYNVVITVYDGYYHRMSLLPCSPTLTGHCSPAPPGICCSSSRTPRAPPGRTPPGWPRPPPPCTGRAPPPPSGPSPRPGNSREWGTIRS